MHNFQSYFFTFSQRTCPRHAVNMRKSPLYPNKCVKRSTFSKNARKKVHFLQHHTHKNVYFRRKGPPPPKFRTGYGPDKKIAHEYSFNTGYDRKAFSQPSCICDFNYQGIKTCFTLCNQKYQLCRSENWHKYNFNTEQWSCVSTWTSWYSSCSSGNSDSTKITLFKCAWRKLETHFTLRSKTTSCTGLKIYTSAVLTPRNDQKVFSQPSHYCNFLYQGTNTFFALCSQDYHLHRSENLHMNIVLTLGMTTKNFHSPSVNVTSPILCFTLRSQNCRLHMTENSRDCIFNTKEWPESFLQPSC